MKLILFRTVLLTLIIELATLFARFVLDLQSSRDTTFIAELTGGLRIHHGYIGILIGLILLSIRQDRRNSAVFQWTLALSLALIASDLIHHFLVLWPLTGDPQFHLVYPEGPQGAH